MVREIPSEWCERECQANQASWADLRRRNTGRDGPHNVKYWGLGNESRLIPPSDG